MKRTYYFDNTRMVYERELRIIGETAYKAMKEDDTKTDWQHHWIRGEFNNLAEAKEYFKRVWGRGDGR